MAYNINGKWNPNANNPIINALKEHVNTGDSGEIFINDELSFSESDYSTYPLSARYYVDDYDNWEDITDKVTRYRLYYNNLTVEPRVAIAKVRLYSVDRFQIVCNVKHLVKFMVQHKSVDYDGYIDEFEGANDYVPNNGIIPYSDGELFFNTSLFPLFDNITDATEYVNSGDYSKAINVNVPPEPEPEPKPEPMKVNYYITNNWNPKLENPIEVELNSHIGTSDSGYFDTYETLVFDENDYTKYPFACKFRYQYENNGTISYTDVYYRATTRINTYYWGIKQKIRVCAYIDLSENVPKIRFVDTSSSSDFGEVETRIYQQSKFEYDGVENDNWYDSSYYTYLPGYDTSSTLVGDFNIYINTTLFPVFENKEDADRYMLTGDYSTALNYEDKDYTYNVDIDGKKYLSDYIDLQSMTLHRVCGKIDSYNGENISDCYLSSTGKKDIGATIIYKLKKEIVEPLSEEVANKLRSIKTNKGYTKFTFDNAGVKLLYNKQFSGYYSDLILGETKDTAYRGDRGKIAYDHSKINGNPHNTTMYDIGLNIETEDIDFTNYFN